jgi:ribosomal protein S18 acetylase RimI-like enzyme
VEIRRLRPGDEAVVRALAEREPQPGVLADERTIFLAAFEAGEAVGFVLAYELLRRHGDPAQLFVYELGVDENRRRQGVGTALWRALGQLARDLGLTGGFLLTNESNERAMRFYESMGATRPVNDDVLLTFDL